MGISRGAGHVIVMAMLTLATGACATDTDRTAPAGSPVEVIQTASAALANVDLPAQERARLFVKRALAHETLGERSDAVSDFTDAIATNALGTEEHATALYDRGVSLDELGRTDAAIADYSSAIELEPTFAAAFNNRGNALRRVGRLTEARRDYEASINVGNPNPEYSKFGLGQIAEALDQPNAAREYYRSALAINPQFALAEARLLALDAGPQSPITRKKPIHHKVTILSPTSDVGPTLKPTIGDVASQASTYVQLGAYRTTVEANEAWDRAQQGAGEFLSSLTPTIVAIDLRGRGRYYRLRLGQPNRASADRLCRVLGTKGIPCVPLRG